MYVMAKNFHFQLLQMSGILNQVPENSQLLLDIKYRLIYIFQYHKDFYHLEEDYLAVLHQFNFYRFYEDIFSLICCCLGISFMEIISRES